MQETREKMMHNAGCKILDAGYIPRGLRSCSSSSSWLKSHLVLPLTPLKLLLQSHYAPLRGRMQTIKRRFCSVNKINPSHASRCPLCLCGETVPPSFRSHNLPINLRNLWIKKSPLVPSLSPPSQEVSSSRFGCCHHEVRA